MYFDLIPLWYQFLVVGTFGLIIGSFLNVVIYRLHTGRSLNGHSHCMSCGKALTWYELIPLVSYLVQRGRCRGCASYVPLRYALCELLTAVLFLLVFSRSGFSLLFLPTLVLMALLVVIFFYDLYHLIIPDVLVVLAIVTSIGILLLTSLDPLYIVVSLLSGVLSTGFFAGLWLVSGGRWIGLGDAKLAFPLALLLGPLGAFSFVIFSFWIGAVISLVLLALGHVYKRGQRYLPIRPKHFTMKSEVPFAPFIIASFLLVFLYKIDVFEVLEHVLSAV